MSTGSVQRGSGGTLRSGASGRDERTLDCVVVGGGIAGLTAAWNLRDRDVLVLEAEDRVGGRMYSERRGDYWLSVGAHMFPEPDSIVGRMVEELNLTTLRIHGEMLGIWFDGHLLRGGRPETFPFRLPLEPRARFDLIRSGLRVRRAAGQYERLSRNTEGLGLNEVRERLLGFMDDRTFADLVGPVHPQVQAIFQATANRMTAEPREVAAGCMAALFAHVWSSSDTLLGRNMQGGSAELPRAIARELGERVLTGATVTRVTSEGPRGVQAIYRRGSETAAVRALYAIVASPAYVTRELLEGASPDLADALASIDYGPFLVAALVTKETSAMPWDNLYSVLTPGLSFAMFFNHANVQRAGGVRRPGGSIMVYAGGRGATRLLDKGDEEIRRVFTADLIRLFPEMKGIIDDIWIHRWPLAQPFQKPGRSKLQATLHQGVGGNVILAGDYVGEWAQLESAAQTGREAAIRVREALRAATLGAAR
jgi:oxygen-dependent protoporphyrinogen oxidase